MLISFQNGEERCSGALRRDRNVREVKGEGRKKTGGMKKNVVHKTLSVSIETKIKKNEIL